MTKIPKTLQPHINGAFPANPCLVGSVLPGGYVQITPRGSVLVFDDEHLAFWERGKGSTSGSLQDGAKITVYYRNVKLREEGILPSGGIARFYGVAKLVRDGELRDRIWDKVVPAEQEKDPERKGFAVLVAVERVEDLGGRPLTLP